MNQNVILSIECNFFGFNFLFAHDEGYFIFRMYQLNLDGREDRVYKKYWDNAAVRFIEDI